MDLQVEQAFVALLNEGQIRPIEAAELERRAEEVGLEAAVAFFRARPAVVRLGEMGIDFDPGPWPTPPREEPPSVPEGMVALSTEDLWKRDGQRDPWRDPWAAGQALEGKVGVAGIGAAAAGLLGRLQLLRERNGDEPQRRLSGRHGNDQVEIARDLAHWESENDIKLTATQAAWLSIAVGVEPPAAPRGDLDQQARDKLLVERDRREKNWGKRLATARKKVNPQKKKR